MSIHCIAQPCIMLPRHADCWHAVPGLPEQVAITRASLQRGMGVVAVKASGKRGCWDMHRPVTSKDVPHVSCGANPQPSFSPIMEHLGGTDYSITKHCLRH